MSTIREVEPHAWAAMEAGRRHDYPAIVSILDELWETHGEGGLGIAVILWIDSTLDGIVPEGPLPSNVFFRPSVQFVHGDTVERAVDNLDEAPPQVAWAARLIAARASWDEKNYVALVQSVPVDDTADYVITLLMCCVETQRQIAKNPGTFITYRPES